MDHKNVLIYETDNLTLFGVDVRISVLSPLRSGTKYQLPLKSHHHLTPSNVTSKHTTLPRRNFLTT